MGKSISVNNSLARDHAERIRRKASQLSDVSTDVKYSIHEGYTAMDDAEHCYDVIKGIIPKIQSRLEEDCQNIAKVADVWKKDDKRIANSMTVTFQESLPSPSI